MLVKKINWDSEKNRALQKERGISFEVITSHIEQGKVIDVVEHQNQDKYPNQKIFIMAIEGYVYLVPFVENEEEVFLKTIIPSRKATRQYLKE